MRSPYDIEEKALLLVFVICLLCPGALCADPNDTFTKRLMRIRIEDQSGLVDGATLEARCQYDQRFEAV